MEERDAPEGAMELFDMVEVLAGVWKTTPERLVETMVYLVQHNSQRPLRWILEAQMYDPANRWKVGAQRHRQFMKVRRLLEGDGN